MSERPDPEQRRSDAQAAPKAASAPAGADGSRASAYVPLPGQSKGKSKALLALAALIAAGAIGGGMMVFRPAPPPQAPIAAAAVAEHKVLWVGEKDVNAAATEALRKNDQKGAAAAGVVVVAAAAAVAPTPAVPPSTVQTPTPPPAPAQTPAPVQTPSPAPVAQTPAAPTSSPLPVAPPELVNPPKAAPQSGITPEAAKAVTGDGFTMFQMQLIDDCAEDGDVVQVFVDGVPMGFLSLSHSGASLNIPLKKGETHKITITAVRDGGGGVTLGLRTSIGDVVSRNLMVGQSDTWDIGFK